LKVEDPDADQERTIGGHDQVKGKLMSKQRGKCSIDEGQHLDVFKKSCEQILHFYDPMRHDSQESAGQFGS
jgi:hypothetical protein